MKVSVNFEGRAAALTVTPEGTQEKQLLAFFADGAQTARVVKQPDGGVQFTVEHSEIRPLHLNAGKET